MKIAYSWFLLLTLLFTTAINAQVSSHLQAAGRKFQQKDYKNALVDCDSAIALDARNVPALYLKGLILNGMSEYTKAIEVFSNVISINASYTMAYRGRLSAYRSQKNYQQAIEDITYCIGISKGRVLSNDYSIRAGIYRQTGDLNAAMADFNKSIETDQTNAFAYSQRAAFFSEQKKYKEALSDINIAIATPGVQNQMFLSIKTMIFQNAGMMDSIQAIAAAATTTRPINASHYKTRALQYRAASKYKEALLDLDTAIALNTLDAQAYSDRAQLYNINLKLYQKAILDYNKAIALNLGRSLNYVKFSLASCYANRGRAKSYIKTISDNEVLSDLDSAIMLSPESPNWWDYKAYFFWGRKRYTEGLQAIDSAIVLEKARAASSSIHMLYRDRKTEFLLALSRKSEALAFTTETINLDINRIESYYLRGTIYSRMHQYKNAITDFSKALQLPSQTRINNCKNNAYLQRAKACSEYGMPKQALADIDSFINRVPSIFASTYITRGIIYRRLDMPEASIADYRMAIEKNSGCCNSAAYNNIGVVQHNSGMYIPAMKSLQTANEIMPNNWYPFGNMGEIMQNLGNYEMAIQYMDSAAIYNKSGVQAFTGKGEIYNVMGDYNRALLFGKQALAKDSMYTGAYQLLSLVSINRGEFEKAIDYLDKEETLRINSPSIYNSRGYCFFRLKQYEKALQQDALSRQVNIDSVYQPFYNYADEARKALQNQLAEHNRVQWVTPVVNTNWLHNATCYQDSSLKLSFSCRIFTKGLFDSTKLIVSVNNKPLPYTASAGNIKTFNNNLTKEKEYLVSLDGLALEKGKNIITITYKNNQSQQLTVINNGRDTPVSFEFARLKYSSKTANTIDPDEEVTSITDLD